MQAEANGSLEEPNGSVAMHTIEMGSNSQYPRTTYIQGSVSKTKHIKNMSIIKARFQRTTIPVAPTHICQVNVRQLGSLIQY